MVYVGVVKERVRAANGEDIRISHDIQLIMAWEMFYALRRYLGRCYGIKGNIVGYRPLVARLSYPVRKGVTINTNEVVMTATRRLAIFTLRHASW
jgi:hypothetical protein